MHRNIAVYGFHLPNKGNAHFSRLLVSSKHPPFEAKKGIKKGCVGKSGITFSGKLLRLPRHSLLEFNGKLPCGVVNLCLAVS
jgi:hypothetical protein